MKKLLIVASMLMLTGCGTTKGTLNLVKGISNDIEKLVDYTDRHIVSDHDDNSNWRYRRMGDRDVRTAKTD